MPAPGREEALYFGQLHGPQSWRVLESELLDTRKAPSLALYRRGRFEQANGGTLFLDEIGELTPDLPVKLCACCGAAHRTRGSSEEIEVDIRVVAASNRIRPMVEQGLFREDLYYRLNVVQIPCRRFVKGGGHSAACAHFVEKVNTENKYAAQKASATRP